MLDKVAAERQQRSDLVLLASGNRFTRAEFAIYTQVPIYVLEIHLQATSYEHQPPLRQDGISFTRFKSFHVSP